MNNQLVINSQQVAIADPTFGGAVSDKGTLQGVRKFVATSCGISIKSIEGKTFKEVKALVGDDAKVKSLQKQYDVNRSRFYAASKQLAALAAADPSMRAETRIVSGKHGVIGVNVKHRFAKENAAARSKNEEIAALRAEIAALKAATAAPAVVTV